MADDDLSQFRKNWLKELSQQNKEPTANTNETRNSEELSSATSNNKSIQPIADSIHPSSSGTTGADKGLQPAGSDEQYVANEGDRQPDNANNPFDQINETSATYYPFRILTTLLNHASTEKVPKQTKRRSDVSDPENTNTAVIPKRAYFADVAEKDAVEGGMTMKAKVDVKDVEHGRRGKETDSQSYLDLFIADLDEISEIPFFDVSLPREVAIKIFWYLDVRDLCRCAQVSRSWRSLAEDELLWCGICHSLGFEQDTLTIQHSNWKSRVRHFTVIKQTLELNWKNRTGRLHNLHHAKGGVLCATHSHHTSVVAGYSNCQTKLWDVMSGETCIFQPSSTALLIDESEEEGTISNEVLHVATCHQVTAAAYSHGFVDVWSNVEEGTEPVYTFTCEGRNSLHLPTSLHLWESEQSVHLCVSTGRHLQVHVVHGGQGCVKDTVVFDSVVKSTQWLQDKEKKASNHVTPLLSVATNSKVNVLAFYDRQLGSSYDMAELHNIVDAPVTCMDVGLNPEQVVVGFTLNTGPTQFFRVDVYDIMTRKTAVTLAGHTASVLCVNMADSPPHCLVTGSQDRKVRVYDTRVGQCPLMTLMGHSAVVTAVQMDGWKVVSGDEGGFVRVWDQRRAGKLWEMNNRHPVRYCQFDERQLVIGHVPYIKQHYSQYDFDTGLHQRHRGSLHVYDFLADQTSQGVPEICLSSYDEPHGYNYNIALAMPYDLV